MEAGNPFGWRRGSGLGVGNKQGNKECAVTGGSLAGLRAFGAEGYRTLQGDEGRYKGVWVGGVAVRERSDYFVQQGEPDTMEDGPWE